MADDFDQFKKDFDKVMSTLISKATLQPVGEDLKNIIQRRTRLGFGVETSGASKEKLVELAPLTIKSRVRKKGLGLLSDLTSPKKSNLTETSEMLGSLKSTVSGSTIEISASGERNKKLTAIHTLGGPNLPARPFLNLAKEDIKQLTALMQDRFSSILDRVFKS